MNDPEPSTSIQTIPDDRAPGDRKPSVWPPRTAPGSAQEAASQRLRSGILEGRYPPGARLPAERKLAAELGVSRLTVREALTTLASEGLVRAHPGSGSEVLDFRRTGALDLFSWLLGQGDATGERLARLFEEVVRIRRPLAVDTLVRAAERATEEDVRALEAIARRQRERLDDPPAYLRGDLEYQRAVLRIVDSTALELLYNSLERVIHERPELTLAFLGPLDEHLATYDMVHELLRRGLPGGSRDDARGFRALAEATLDVIEARGLRRVRRLCREGGA